jgi:hypothetical protein
LLKQSPPYQLERTGAMGWVAWTIGYEDAVEVMLESVVSHRTGVIQPWKTYCHLVDWVIEWECRDGCSSADEAAKNVFLDAYKISLLFRSQAGSMVNLPQSINAMWRSPSFEVTWNGALVDTRRTRLMPSGSTSKEEGHDQHTLMGLRRSSSLEIRTSFILVSVPLLSDRDPTKGRALLPQKGYNGTSIDATDCGNTLTSTPFSQTFNSSPMAVLFCLVCHHNASSLDIRRLEIAKETVLISGRGWHTIISNYTG